MTDNKIKDTEEKLSIQMQTKPQQVSNDMAIQNSEIQLNIKAQQIPAKVYLSGNTIILKPERPVEYRTHVAEIMFVGEDGSLCSFINQSQLHQISTDITENFNKKIDTTYKSIKQDIQAISSSQIHFRSKQRSRHEKITTTETKTEEKCNDQNEQDEDILTIIQREKGNIFDSKINDFNSKYVERIKFILSVYYIWILNNENKR
eukprot:537203_1